MNLSIFAERLSELMFDANISPSKLAEIVDCDRSSITRYLGGNKMPTVDACTKIANYFNCSLDYLFGLENEFYEQKYNSVKPFSDRLPELLKHFNISRYKLEKLTGISESTLYYWSKRKTTPTIEKIILISKTLDCSIDFVLGRTTV